MRLILSTTLALLLTPTVWGQAQIQRYRGEAVPRKYIVKLKDGASRTPLISELGGDDVIGHQYSKNIINGFAAELDSSALQIVQSDPSVETVYEDGLMDPGTIVTQTNAPWGLERISKPAPVVPFGDVFGYNYTRDDRDGEGVDVYVLDTGIYVDHVEFEGRARWGKSFATGFPNMEDRHGHGTHCAGTVGSKSYGVAKKASLIAVKVLGDNGPGLWSDFIAGVDWTISQASVSGRPSVISMSIQGLYYQPANDAVAAAVSAGIHVVVAAGNYGDDAQLFSPGGSMSAITVGATDITDYWASFSNYGPAVDIHAPGVDVYSTYIGSPTSFVAMTGSSMATPHVAGLVAYLISINGNSSPAAMIAYLQSIALEGAINNLPNGTPNYLAQNGIKTLQRRGQVFRKDLVGKEKYWTRADRFGKRKATPA